MQLIEAAKRYIKNGISVIATGNDKRSIYPWKAFQSRKLSDIELQTQFSHVKAENIAIVCGAISGSLEVIDVDTKYDLTGTLFEDLMAAINEAKPELSDKLFVVQTRSGGYHLYYYCPFIEGNLKLARRPASAEEIKENPHEKVLVLIETRGEGGYVIAPPSKGYKIISGTAIPTITKEDRELLFEVSRSFNQYVEEQAKPVAAKQQTEGFAITPWEDYNQRGADHMLRTLEKHGWTFVKKHGPKHIYKRPGKSDSKSSGDYNEDLNFFAVFTTSSEFEVQKGYRPAAVYAILEHRNDWKAAAKALADLGYGEKKQHYGSGLEKELFQKKTEGYSKEELVKILQSNKHNKSETEAKEIVDSYEKIWGEDLCLFWDVTKDKKIQINRSRFIEFLHTVGGFGLYFYDTNSTIYRIVRVKDGFAEESATEQMKKFILDYIDSLPDAFDGGITPADLKEVIIKQYNNLFNEGFLEFLPHSELTFLKDNAGNSFFAFANGVVVVNAQGISLTSYKTINSVIWKNQVIAFDISIDQTFDPQMCEYYRFIERISGGEQERLHYCITLIGYMLHRFKDPSKPYAMVLAEETESDKDGGGTGKGIFIKALAYLLKTIKIDGKNFKIDKNFSMQRVTLDTQLIVIEDCAKNIDFEAFNSQITEGSTVEKKNKDELFIDYKDSPKFAFTTNYTLNIKGNHGKRRTKVFEFAPFFGPANTPQDYFGHLLFEAWDADEWNRFYNLMFFCLSLYLKVGIREVAGSEKMKRKSIKLGFGEEFLEWWESYLNNDPNEWKSFKELYNNFMIENDFEKKEFGQKRFKKGMEIASELYENRVSTRRNGSKNNQHEVKLEIEVDKKYLKAV
jgi:hypothetical protein